MTDEQRVVGFKCKLDKAMKSYFFTELAVDFVIIAIGAIALFFVLRMDNETAVMLVALCVFAAIFLASFLIIKILFGSFSGMNRINSFRTRVDFAIKTMESSKKEHQKGKLSDGDLAIAQAIYNDEMSNLVKEIDAIKIKK